MLQDILMIVRSLGALDAEIGGNMILSICSSLYTLVGKYVCI